MAKINPHKVRQAARKFVELKGDTANEEVVPAIAAAALESTGMDREDPDFNRIAVWLETNRSTLRKSISDYDLKHGVT